MKQLSDQAKKYQREATREHKRIDNTIDRLVGRPAQSVYRDEQSRVFTSITKGASRKVTPAVRAQLARQAEQGMVRLGAGIGHELRNAAQATSTESIASLNRFFHSMKMPVQISDAQAQAIIQKRLRAIQERQLRNASKTLADAATSVGEKVGGMTGETVGALAEEIDGTIGMEWWRVERLLQTESAYVYNTIRDAALEDVSKTTPGMLRRWTERVDDSTGKPLDKRVAEDSLVLHGQLAAPGDVFVMPGWGGTKMTDRMAGDTWDHPPNRPNDRAVLTPWMRGMGVPGWLIRNGRKVNLR